jgi:inner membrane protein
MHRPLLYKFIIIAILILAILIPLDMIRDTIAERKAYRQQAVATIAESYAGPQTLVGPLLVVPYLVEVQTTHNDENGMTHTVVHNEWLQWVFYPKSERLTGYLKPDRRYLGLHEVRVYAMTATVGGRFDLVVPQPASGSRLLLVGTPFLSIGIDDVRGLIGTPQLLVDNRPTLLSQGIGAGRAGGGVHAELAPLAPGDKRSLTFAMDFALGGTESLAVAPTADDNRIELTSSWPSPEFTGRFLPSSREVSAKGFHAVWDVSALAANTQNQYGEGDPAKTDSLDRVEVTLVDPVNIYTQADRASKYGLLFVLLTFIGFFMVELIKQLRIHPIQYLLVGLALAIFFLLLLSLSEHIAFIWAYLSASGACIGLLGFYLSSVLRSRARGAGFAAMLTTLYGVLYGLLISEDNALVLGSLMLFAILAAIMIVTRKIDWYGVAKAPEPFAPTPSTPPARPEFDWS